MTINVLPANLSANLSTDLTTQVKLAAQDLGFDLVGVASVDDPTLADTMSFYEKWCESGNNAGMDYLKKHQTLKSNPKSLLLEAASVICVGLLYGSGKQPVETTSTPKVSQYARGRDYHEVLTEKLSLLGTALEKLSGTPVKVRRFVDTEPVLERFWAWRAGLGWLGKNTCLINRKQGSYLFLGGLLTNLILVPDSPQPDHCGRCRKCIDACPTGALIAGSPETGRAYLDARNCIAYHTIENRADVPPQIAGATGTWIAGCDICQDVCPWNDPITPATHSEGPNAMFTASFSQLTEWTESDFKKNIKRAALNRMKYTMFLRNLLIAVNNSALPSDEKKIIESKVTNRLKPAD